MLFGNPTQEQEEESKRKSGLKPELTRTEEKVAVDLLEALKSNVKTEVEKAISKPYEEIRKLIELQVREKIKTNI